MGVVGVFEAFNELEVLFNLCYVLKKWRERRHEMMIGFVILEEEIKWFEMPLINKVILRPSLVNGEGMWPHNKTYTTTHTNLINHIFSDSLSLSLSLS